MPTSEKTMKLLFGDASESVQNDGKGTEYVADFERTLNSLKNAMATEIRLSGKKTPHYKSLVSEFNSRLGDIDAMVKGLQVLKEKFKIVK